MAKQQLSFALRIHAGPGLGQFGRTLHYRGSSTCQRLDVFGNPGAVVQHHALYIALQQQMMLVLAMNVCEQRAQFAQRLYRDRPAVDEAA